MGQRSLRSAVPEVRCQARQSYQAAQRQEKLHLAQNTLAPLPLVMCSTPERAAPLPRKLPCGCLCLAACRGLLLRQSIRRDAVLLLGLPHRPRA